MRYQLTITGTLDTPADEDQIEADFPIFAPWIEAVHTGITPGSVQLVSVERVPDPEPVGEPVGEHEASRSA